MPSRNVSTHRALSTGVSPKQCGSGPRRIPCWRFFVSYMICEHNGSVRRCDVRSDSDERQPRLCAAAVRDTRRTHSADGHLKRALEREVCKVRLFARSGNPINSIPKQRQSGSLPIQVAAVRRGHYNNILKRVLGLPLGRLVGRPISNMVYHMFYLLLPFDIACKIY